nr:ribonuclease H-like domain, reverse transcriptase, RNA-dependent DNA polymerase [Tanacetum cinerariifolium]
MRYLRVFGCKAYVKVTKPHLKRDVKFKEDEGWDWKGYLDNINPSKPEWMDFIISENKTSCSRNINEVSTQDSERNNEDSTPSPIQNITDDDKIEQPIDSTGHTSSIASSSRPLDHTPVQGYINLSEIYNRAPEQAPRKGNMKLDQTLKSLNFKKCTLEQAIYTRIKKDSMLLVGVYVDDLIVTRRSKEDLQKFKSQMEERFEISDLGLLAYYLGIEVTQTEYGILIKQTGYANKILKEGRMVDSNETKIPMDPGTKLIKTEGGELVDATKYRSLIGCLRYLFHTRPDLSYSVILLSRFMQEPKEQHMKELTNKMELSEKPTVALSSCESEFMAATTAACQALWLQ